MIFPNDRKRIASAADRASGIAALCSFLADALAADPETALASEAVELLAGVATGLSDDLNRVLSGDEA